MGSLKDVARSGLLWSVFERFGQQGCGFLVQIVLARLLAPEQFGLIAMVAVFVALCRGIADAGFHEAIIQKAELDDRLIATVFYANLGLSCALTASLWFLAPLVADFYSQAQLTFLLRILSLALVIDGFARIQLSLLQRELKFRPIATSTLLATFLSGAIAIVLAYNGLGVWALVWQVLFQRCFMAVLVWWKSDWRPKLVFSLGSIQEVIPFASRMFAANILNNVFQQLYVLMIGRLGSPVELGYYQRADSFKRLASTTSNTLMARITFPLFSKIQDEPERLARGFIKASRLLVFLFFPFMSVLAAVGDPLIVTLIGEKWLPTVPYLQLLCVVGALHPVSAINLSVIKALGEGGMFLRLEVIKKVMIVLVLGITCRYGVYAVVWGQVLCGVFALCVNGFYTNHLISVTYWQQFKMYIGATLLSVFIAFSVLSVLRYVDAIAPIRLLTALCLGGVLWLVGVWLCRRSFAEELEWFNGEFRLVPLVGKFVERFVV